MKKLLIFTMLFIASLTSYSQSTEIPELIEDRRYWDYINARQSICQEELYPGFKAFLKYKKQDDGSYVAMIYNNITTETFDGNLVIPEEFTFETTYDGTVTAKIIGFYKLSMNLEKYVSVTLPYNLEFMGPDAFWGCRNLERVTFTPKVTEDAKGNVTFDNNPGLTVIPDRAFQNCQNLQSLTIPNHVEMIGHQALQYNYALSNIELPNSLTTLGAHFLCSNLGINSFILPAGVKKIDGAFLHGCQNLHSVYIMGDPDYLKMPTDEEQLHNNEFIPFTENYKTAGTEEEAKYFGPVNNCTFYVRNKATYDLYAAHETWKQVDAANNSLGNKYEWLDINGNRTLKAGRWITFCSPVDIDRATAETMFGTGCIVTVMTQAEAVPADGWSQSRRYPYYLTFTAGDGSIAKNIPYLIKAGTVEEGHIMHMPTFDNSTEAAFMSGDAYTWQVTQMKNIMKDNGNLTEEQKTESGTYVRMSGTYTGKMLQTGEFFFKNVEESAGTWKPGFFRVAQDGQNPVGQFKCYWQVLDKDRNIVTEAKMGYVDDTEQKETGIVRIALEPIDNNSPVYTLDGRRMKTTDVNRLPKGMYVSNHRKFIIK